MPAIRCIDSVGFLRSNGIVLSGIGIGSVPPEVFAKARGEALPRLFAMVASGTRVVLTP
jgi:hypothetical protein